MWCNWLCGVIGNDHIAHSKRSRIFGRQSVGTAANVEKMDLGRALSIAPVTKPWNGKSPSLKNS